MKAVVMMTRSEVWKMGAEDYPESDPRHHTQKVQGMLQDLADHLREDIRKIDEPQAEAMFETAAEVLLGLKKAFADYEEKDEAAWE